MLSTSYCTSLNSLIYTSKNKHVLIEQNLLETNCTYNTSKEKICIGKKEKKKLIVKINITKNVNILFKSIDKYLIIYTNLNTQY